MSTEPPSAHGPDPTKDPASADRSGQIDLNSVLEVAEGVRLSGLGEGGLVVSSDVLQVRLEGASAGVFLEQVLRRLDGRTSLVEVLANWSQAAQAEAIALLERLLDAGAVRLQGTGGTDPAQAMIEALGIGPSGPERLRALRIGVVGLEGPGAHALALLSAQGVGRFTVVDPFECTEGDLVLWPSNPAGAVGRARQDSAGALAPGATIDTPLGWPFDREDLAGALADCDLVVHAFDRGFSASALWVNAFALAEQRPAVFGRVETHRAYAGPMVFPGEGPCYLCARMRALSCADDFDLEMALEEELDRTRAPALASQASFPALSAWLGSVLALEVTKTVMGVGRPALVGQLQVYDSLESQTRSHAVLQNPQCPACRKKGRRPGAPGPLGAPARTDEGLVGLRDTLVSDRTGIVRSLTAVPRDTTEPAWPVVVRAEISNHRFLGHDDDPFEVCSGKGMTMAQGITSALGEACERYSGGRLDQERVVRASRRGLGRPALSGQDLVPFAEHQYEQLQYARWSEDTERDWVDGYDVTTGEPVAVPLIACLMHYEVPTAREYLFPITSNGLAAGPSRDGAVLAAALEVIERDAFVIGWMQRLPALRVRTEDVADRTVQELVTAYARREVDLELYRLPTDAPAAVIASVGVDRSGRRPAIVVGLGCDPDPHVACRKAALEIGQVRPALKARLRDPEVARRLVEIVDDPSRVTDLEDHDLLYAHEAMTDRLAFWREAPVDAAALAGTAQEADSTLEGIAAGLAAIGSRLVAVDLTAPELAQLGIHSARALITGFQPIHFGASEARLGGQRMYDLPGRLGLTPLSTEPTKLNPDPHPLA